MPLERTSRGSHLWVEVSDLPEIFQNLGSAPKVDINSHPGVDLAFYASRLNIVVSPSMHLTGHRYRFERMGEGPSDDMARAFERPWHYHGPNNISRWK
jgi:hypothetical protein